MSGAREVLHQRAVRRYLVSTAFGSIGLNLMVTVLFKQAYDMTGDELTIGLLGLAQFIPAVLLVLVSGWVADRFDRRRVSAVFIFARGTCALALALYSLSDPTDVWPMFAIAAAMGAADAMLAPARRSIPPLISTHQQFPHVIALWTATFTGAAIVGPVLGGFLYTVGPAEAYTVAAIMEMLAIAPVLMIRYLREPERMTDRPTLSKALEGLHFVVRTPIVLAAISLDLFAVLFGGAIALIPAVAEERLGVGDIAYGWLRAAPGIGAAAMAIVLAIAPIRRRVGPTLLVVVAIFGLGTIVFGLTTSYAVAFVALVVISAADMVSMFIRGSLVPLATPQEQLGRVTAVEGVFIGASNELGAFESGVAARAFGLPWSIAAGGMITLLVATSFAWLFPSLREIDTFDEVRPTEPAVV
ncbi:MAG TPA: MFS transporter [Ilumatobacter sp.]|nr:MFS transporter [Ilumatobacter sp.]